MFAPNLLRVYAYVNINFNVYQVSMTRSEKCRKAQLAYVHKMKKEIWGRAAVGMESNFSTNPKILVLKEVSFN